MPDKVIKWISFLNDLKENFYMFFGQKLLIAIESLNNEDFEPTEQEIKFAEQLYNDFKVTDEIFGLREELLNNPEFEEEFRQFCLISTSNIYDYPLLYEFVKEKIYYIIINQQQVEGLFNKLDLKTHPNMLSNIKQSKLRLLLGNIDKENIAFELAEIHVKCQKKILSMKGI
ncbi:hypothetical protein C2G38_2043499 [Gigaspora rosea]|uniref:Uncharacterized protein n=1 Tax=Gigaspora rosea TaxID=44941 RepID=A0A397UJW3_9GLOM|nr:hypothetical protein C2G38_2043499 [Gigaspora rosea]